MRSVLLPLAIAVVVTGCGGGDDPAAAPTTATPAAATGADSTADSAREAAVVRVPDFRFEPARAEVTVGQTVRWQFDHRELHNATADDGSFRSKALNDGATFEHRFDRPGTYRYLCTLHPQMTGEVVVR